MRDHIRGAICGATKGIGLGRVMRRAAMSVMAIEDGLFPLAYVTHTIKYLQQCKFSRSIKKKHSQTTGYTTSARFWSHTAEMAESKRLSRCWRRRFTRPRVWMRSSAKPACFSRLCSLLHEWRKSTVARWLKWKKRKRGARGEDRAALHPAWLHWM